MPRQHASWPVILAAAALLLPVPGRAADPDLLNDRFFLSLGGFIFNTDTKVQLDGTSERGSLVDLEETFGDDDTTRLRMDAWWRLTERQKLRAFWFSSDARRTRTIDREIDYGDETFPVGADVTLERDFDVLAVAWEYAFLRKPSWELTGSAGLHYTNLSLGLSATLDDAGAPGGTREASESGDLDVPLPVIGLRGLWNPGGHFWLDASGQIFSLSFDDFDGTLTDWRIAAVWQPKRWLGIGVGYNGFLVDVDVTKDKFTGSLDWGYSGPNIFFSGSF